MAVFFGAVHVGQVNVKRIIVGLTGFGNRFQTDTFAGKNDLGRLSLIDIDLTIDTTGFAGFIVDGNDPIGSDRGIDGFGFRIPDRVQLHRDFCCGDGNAADSGDGGENHFFHVGTPLYIIILINSAQNEHFKHTIAFI